MLKGNPPFMSDCVIIYACGHIKTTKLFARKLVRSPFQCVNCVNKKNRREWYGTKDRYTLADKVMV